MRVIRIKNDMEKERVDKIKKSNRERECECEKEHES